MPSAELLNDLRCQVSQVRCSQQAPDPCADVEGPWVCSTCRVYRACVQEQGTCKFPGCIALANVGRDHCVIHYPENVAQRAVTIVTTHLWPLISRKQPWVRDTETPGFQKRIAAIRDEIVNAIRRTI